MSRDKPALYCNKMEIKEHNFFIRWVLTTCSCFGKFEYSKDNVRIVWGILHTGTHIRGMQSRQIKKIWPYLKSITGSGQCQEGVKYKQCCC